jgi:GT2 family glycosyltransferase
MIGSARVAVVVPVHNKIELTQRFLGSFQKVTYPNYTLIIVDDGSTDGTSEIVKQHYPHVVVLQGDGELWWSGATNLGTSYALAHGYDYVLTINNDTLVHPDFLSQLVATAEANPRSIVGSRINFMEEPSRVWAAGTEMWWKSGCVLQLWCNRLHECMVLALRPSPWPTPALTGCGTLVPADCYREVGLYDTKRCPQYHGDSEFTLRARARGYAALVDLHAVVWNDAGNTSPITRGWRGFFSKRSPMYWRPILTIHMNYCPRRFRLNSLSQQYSRQPVWMSLMVAILLGLWTGRNLRRLWRRLSELIKHTPYRIVRPSPLTAGKHFS